MLGRVRCAQPRLAKQLGMLNGEAKASTPMECICSLINQVILRRVYSTCSSVFSFYIAIICLGDASLSMIFMKSYMVLL